MRTCVKETQDEHLGAAALRYCDVLDLSFTHLNSLKPEVQHRINRRDVNRDVKYAPLHAERGSLSTFLVCRLYYPTPMLPRALSLSSRLRLPRERNRILSFNSTILRLLSLTLVPLFLYPVSLRVEIDQDLPRIFAGDPRRSITSILPSFLSASAGQIFYRDQSIPRYDDLRISPQARPYRWARNIARIMTSLPETRQLPAKNTRERKEGKRYIFEYSSFPTY